jgi:hypothetical protein
MTASIELNIIPAAFVKIALSIFAKSALKLGPNTSRKGPPDSVLVLAHDSTCTRHDPVVIPIDLLSSHFSSLENSMLLDMWRVSKVFFFFTELYWRVIYPKV